MKLLDKDWKYINEGNAHIVLELIGTSYVLRLIKEDGKPTHLEIVQAYVDFVNMIMSPLLVDQNIKQEIITISEEVLSDLSSALHDIRPAYRRHKSKLSPYAIKAPNLLIVSSDSKLNFSVEIKPKEGFISKSLSKYNKCYFCLKQYLKLENKEITCLSRYCPLFLFSGDKKKMKKALLGLIETPQNNFKLFENGVLLYGDKCNNNTFEDIMKKMNILSVDVFIESLIKILCQDMSYKQDDYKESSYINRNTLLNRLLRIQMLGENTEINKHKEINNYDYVPNILQKIKGTKLDLTLKAHKEIFFESLDSIHLALISAVAKDCSIMISFSPNLNEKYSSIQICDRTMSYKLSITDLEPKSVKTLAKRQITEKQIIQAYKNFLMHGRKDECKIQPHTETRTKQLEAWEQLITEYMKTTKQSTVDIRESQNSPLFNNASINRKLTQEAILTILEDMAKTGRAAPIDKSKNVWEIYWHSLDEWGNMIYNWACNSGMNNSVCTLFELREGDNTADQEFHGLDMNVLIKSLKTLEMKGKCELMEFNDSQGVKFF